MAIDPYTARPEDHPWAASKRFGALAYMAPINAWPTAESVAQNYGLGLSEVEPNVFRFTYNRTGRTLGDVVSTEGKGRIKPYAADQILDRAELFDRIDPNYIQYDLSGDRQKGSNLNPLAQAMVNLKDPYANTSRLATPLPKTPFQTAVGNLYGGGGGF